MNKYSNYKKTTKTIKQPSNQKDRFFYVSIEDKHIQQWREDDEPSIDVRMNKSKLNNISNEHKTEANNRKTKRKNIYYNYSTQMKTMNRFI